MKTLFAFGFLTTLGLFCGTAQAQDKYLLPQKTSDQYYAKCKAYMRKTAAHPETLRFGNRFKDSPAVFMFEPDGSVDVSTELDVIGESVDQQGVFARYSCVINLKGGKITSIDLE